ncbi:hypothetical protein BD779DRAFT_1498694 [Infundibulicybe gibba]|nr:hypothetical protein BD779DRAFT_1498694 [Infundibulicybe gibba]
MALSNAGHLSSQIASEIHYRRNNQPSAPIEIPQQGKASIPGPLSPLGRPTSPELIFEMSPVFSNFSPSTHYSFSISTSHNKEPFLYQFPICSARQVKSGHLTPPDLAYTGICAMEGESSPDKENAPIVCNSIACRGNDRQRLPSKINPILPQADAKYCTTKKITGFVPIIPPETPVQSSQTYGRLSPPPRSSSFTSSPWLLPGKGDIKEEDISSVDIDPSAFEKYLTRRIESQKPIRIRGSMRD